MEIERVRQVNLPGDDLGGGFYSPFDERIDYFTLHCSTELGTMFCNVVPWVSTA